MVRADGAQVIGVYIDTFVDEPIIAGDVDASKRLEGRTEFMVVKKWIWVVGNQ